MGRARKKGWGQTTTAERGSEEKWGRGCPPRHILMRSKITWATGEASCALLTSSPCLILRGVGVGITEYRGTLGPPDCLALDLSSFWVSSPHLSPMPGTKLGPVFLSTPPLIWYRTRAPIFPMRLQGSSAGEPVGTNSATGVQSSDGRELPCADRNWTGFSFQSSPPLGNCQV